MQLRSCFSLCIGLFVSQWSFGAACPSSSTSTSVGALSNTNCTVSGSASTIQLNFKSGFDDSTFVSASGGNNGTTIGAQRKLSFIKAAEVLADQVKSTQPILVDADFSALSCNASVATLGSAGPSTFTANVATPIPTGSLSNTFYPIGLINSIGGSDYRPSLSDINASFNINLGQSNCLAGSFWYYGFDAPSGHNIGFTTVLLHEMTHGLGFSSLTNASTGEKPNGIDDIFSNFLYSLDNSASWSVADGLSNGQRAASAVSGDALLWNGPNVNAEAVDLLTAGFHDADNSSSFSAGDRVQMYAPNPVEGGSSVSHFDTAASPNEIMEPQYTAGQLDLGLALYLLKDIGWQIITNDTMIEVAGTNYSDGDRFVLPIATTQVNVNNGTGNYSYRLDYNSADASNLITPNSRGFVFGLPESGEFSGDYILTVTDNSTGDVVALTVYRPLRLNWSATSLLNGNTEQILKVEGGAAGTLYSLQQSGAEDLIFLNDNGVEVLSGSAENNAETFNAAQFSLDTKVVANESSMNVTVESRYADVVERDVKVYPASLHQFSVKDSSGSGISNASAALNSNDVLLDAVNIPTTYDADDEGQFTLLLPDTLALSAESNYSIQLSADGYNSETVMVNSNNLNHDVTLTELFTGITLSGNIMAKAGQNLLQAAPVVTIQFSDDTRETVPVSVISLTEARFSIEVDLNVKSLDLLTISQLNSATVQLNLANITQTQTLYIALSSVESNTLTTTETTGESSSAAGSFSGFNAFLFMLAIAGGLRLRCTRDESSVF